MLQDLLKYIEDNTSLEIGVSLFYGFFPAKTMAGGEVRERATRAQETGGPEYPDLVDRADMAINFISRAKEYEDAKADSYEIHNLLHGLTGIKLPLFDGSSGCNYVAMEIEASSVPGYLEEDENGRHVFSLNIVARVRDK